MLSGESHTAEALDNYLHFEYDGTDTTLYISDTPAFGDGNAVGAPSGAVTGNTVQNIVFSGVDLIGTSTTDSEVIQNLIDSNKIITD